MNETQAEFLPVERIPVRQAGKLESPAVAHAWRIGLGKERLLVFLNHAKPGATFEVDGRQVSGRVCVGRSSRGVLELRQIC